MLIIDDNLAYSARGSLIEYLISSLRGLKRSERGNNRCGAKKEKGNCNHLIWPTTISLSLCPGQESNLHALRHTHLKRARLPIPPPGLPSALRVSLPFVERAKIHIKLKKQKYFLKFSRSTKPPSTLCSRLLEFAKSEN